MSSSEKENTVASKASAALVASEGDESSSSGGSSQRETRKGYFGWVYHLGVNSIGHEYCHLRFLFLSGKHLTMYKRDPHENPDVKPIRKGIVSHTLMVEELGRRKVDHGDVYVLRLYNRLDESKKGEIACANSGEARKWMEAFEQAKQQVEYELLRGSGRQKLNADTELNLEGHRPRVRRYANSLRNLIRIGKGPEMLIRQSSDLGRNFGAKTFSDADVGDAIEAHEWRCVHSIHGIRIFEDVSNSKNGKNFLLKSVGVVDANLDTVFEVILSLDKNKRYEWDVLTADVELIDSVNGHFDIVYGTYDPSFLSWWNSKRDFIFSRQWFRGQDGSYTILQFPALHKNKPPQTGYRRTKIYSSIWEIQKLHTTGSSNSKCLVTHMLEVHVNIWDRWKKFNYSDFERTIPFALLCQVAGLKEYFGTNPSLTLDSPSIIVHSSIPDTSRFITEFEDAETKEDEFYDALANGDLLEDEDSDDGDDPPKAGKLRLKNISWAIASLAVSRSSVLLRNELDDTLAPISINPDQFHGSLNRGKGEIGTNCWTTPRGQGFMIRGKTYLTDYSKVTGGDPLLKLLAVDWLRSDDIISNVALRSGSLVQLAPGEKIPFIMVINLQIPAKPNYSLVLYYGAERPVRKGSLLGKFIDGTDIFRNARFKLIPSIIEGYWMVKRAVGTKACLLGKAVTCRYLKQDNFLEIDVDIGSSSVARSIIGLVLGYVTSIVVDLAILIEAKEESELPEYILGTVRLNTLRPDSAVPV